MAAVSVVLGVVALGNGGEGSPEAASTARPATSESLPPVTTTTSLPATSTSPPTTTIATVEVPKLVGLRQASAKAALAGRGLRARVTYRSTRAIPRGR